MQTVHLRQADLDLTRLGFGCASLMRVTSAKARQQLLAAAFENGICHFDVARLYGLGASEREVGLFASSRRDQITIATKFGIDPAGGLGTLARFQKPARAFLNRVPAARNAVKRRSESLLAPRSYDAAHARRSFDTSLRELNVEYVDILFVHDPGPRDEVRSEELVSLFEALRAAGKIRAWGVSQDAHPGLDFVGPLGPSAVLQVRSDVFNRTESNAPRITFGVLGGAHARISTALRADDASHRAWSEHLGLDPLHGTSLAQLILAAALDANPDGSVLYSTIRPSRVPLAALALSDPPSRELRDRFRHLVSSLSGLVS